MLYDPCSAFASSSLFRHLMQKDEVEDGGEKVLSKLIKIELNVYFKSVIAGDESAALKRSSMNSLCQMW